ncbi:TetR/AcrR family transcriptional regulator [Rhizobium mongolense]
MARNNRERTDATRTALLDAARALFVDRGYAETATPNIVAAANVTRGALYHHFPDKKALFTAVVEREGAAVASEIEKRSSATSSARDAILAGAAAYFGAMAVPGRTRLLLLQAPALVNEDQVESTLRSGLSALLATSGSLGLVDPLTVLLSAAFDRAALEIDRGRKRSDYEEAIVTLIDGLVD